MHGSISPVIGEAWNTVTITFMDDPEPYTSHETVAVVTRAIKKAVRLDSIFANDNLYTGSSREFINKVRCVVLLVLSPRIVTPLVTFVLTFFPEQAFSSSGSAQFNGGAFSIADDMDSTYDNSGDWETPDFGDN